MATTTDSDAEQFVDATCILRKLGPEAAAQHGVTAEDIQAMLVDVTKEDFNRGPWSCWLTFRDGSTAAQKRGSRRWDMDR